MDPLPFLPRPWTICESKEAFWIEASNGKRFAYVYWRVQPIVGTGDARLSREEAFQAVCELASVLELREVVGE